MQLHIHIDHVIARAREQARENSCSESGEYAHMAGQLASIVSMMLSSDESVETWRRIFRAYVEGVQTQAWGQQLLGNFMRGVGQ